MDIAALSMEMSAMKTDYEAKAGILKMVMDVNAEVATKLLDEMKEFEQELSEMVLSHLGQSLDASV